jgi:iron complex transport system substrate-binding protein
MRRPRLALCAALVAITACGSDGSNRAATSVESQTSGGPGTAVSTTTTSAGTDAMRPSVDRPERIVSLSPSLTEMLFAIGAGDQVIAVDQYSNYPPEAPRTDLSGFSPNVEAIAALDPDLVVLANDRDGVVDALERTGIATLLLERAASIDETLAEIVQLGGVTGHAEAAALLVEQMTVDLDQLAARVPGREAPLRAYYEVSDSGHSATSATFVGDVLGRAGIVSIADGVDDAAGGFPQLSAEYVLAADPDVILLAHSDGENPTPAELAARSGWAELSAIRDGRVVELDPDLAGRWGPRLVDLMAAAVDATA